MNAFFEKKLYLFILAIFFLSASLFGSHEVPVRHLLTNFDFFQIFNLLVSKENIFRPPDTVIRFLLFFISILTLLFSFMLKSDNRNQVSNSMKNTITALSLLFFITILITENIYNIAALLVISLSIYYAIFYGKKSFNRYEVILLFSYFSGLKSVIAAVQTAISTGKAFFVSAYIWSADSTFITFMLFVGFGPE